MCLSICMDQLGYHWTDFHVILYFSIFKKPVKKLQMLLKSHKDNEYFIWKPTHMYDKISFNSS